MHNVYVIAPFPPSYALQDEVIHVSHGHALHEACPGSIEPLWVHGAGHNDVEAHAVYLDKVAAFVEGLRLAVYADRQAHGGHGSVPIAPEGGLAGQLVEL